MTLAFHEQLKESTWTEHQRIATSPYVRELLHGRVNRRDCAQLVIGHHFAYAVLERASRDLAADPLAGRFVRTELYRVAPIETACADPVSFVAHHYVRYLGDLSGGQIIARRLAPVYDGLGLRFYSFGEISDIDGSRRNIGAYSTPSRSARASGAHSSPRPPSRTV